MGSVADELLDVIAAAARRADRHNGAVVPGWFAEDDLVRGVIDRVRGRAEEDVVIYDDMPDEPTSTLRWVKYPDTAFALGDGEWDHVTVARRIVASAPAIACDRCGGHEGELGVDGFVLAGHATLPNFLLFVLCTGCRRTFRLRGEEIITLA